MNEMQVIAHIHTDFPTKFGIPRQSGLVGELKGTIVFTPPYRNPDAVRGLDGFSHIWLIWQFSESIRSDWSATVRPPRLGGNTRMGVFATRSPFRPNPIGLSSVRLLDVELHPELGPILHVAGADLMDGTPIFDLKPYVPLSDCHPEASGGFSPAQNLPLLKVDCPEALLNRLPERARNALLGVLAQDPRPAYQSDPERRYGLPFAGFDVRFVVEGDRLRVVDMVRLDGAPHEEGRKD